MLAEIRPPLTGVLVADSLQGLSRIKEPQAEAVLYSRRVPGNVQAYLSEVSRGAFQNGRFQLRAADIHACVNAHFGANGFASSASLEWLAGDVQALAGHIGALFKARDLRLRLEVVTNDACRKFHADNVKARLICTYSGPGTDIALAEEGEAPGEIFRVPGGEAILLKGLKWPGDKARALKHRSPPIEAAGHTRFVVVLEPVTADTEQLSSSYLPYSAGCLSAR